MQKFSALVLAAALLAAPAFAAGLTAEQVIERVVSVKNDDGTVSTKLQPADKVLPGEQLVYSLKFDNQGVEPARNVVLTVPVPREVAYVENSATAAAANVVFSADNGRTFAPRGDLQVSVNGQQRDALATEITHVRWEMTEPLAPGQKGALVFKAVLK